jgi:phosphoribosylformylglycinamidine synthase subunit PurQ / glutaminase
VTAGGGNSRKIGVLRFPGTNCDRDIYHATGQAGHKAEWLWHLDRFDFRKFDALLLPGGFSYGDYLRCGALAARSPVMDSVREAALYGTPIMGVCNGFQILCESGLLPGALLRNKDGRFIDEWVNLSLVSEQTFFRCEPKLKLPIAHAEGRYHIDSDGLKQLQDNQMIWLRYDSNPNGALDDIAGVMNKKRNVVALMPHPERAFYSWMGGTSGRSFFDMNI